MSAYRVVATELLTFESAQAACAALGQQLAIVRDAADQAALASSLETVGGSLVHVWIGASDAYREGTWRWVDGSAVDFFDWGFNQPADPGNEDCVVLFKVSTGWKWYDHGCGRSASYACSALSPPLPPHVPSPPSAPPASPSPPLPPVESTSYLMSTTMTQPDPGPLTWSNAQTHCVGLGLQLAIVRTMDDQAVLEATLAASGASSTMFWLGLSRATSSANWVWVDGTPLSETYSNWVSAKPSGIFNHCAETYFSANWQWNNGHCEGTRQFICSPPPPSPPPPAPPRLPPAPPTMPLPPMLPSPRPVPSPPTPPTPAVGSSADLENDGTGAGTSTGTSTGAGGLADGALVGIIVGGVIGLLLLSFVTYKLVQRCLLTEKRSMPQMSVSTVSTTVEPVSGIRPGVEMYSPPEIGKI